MTLRDAPDPDRTGARRPGTPGLLGVSRRICLASAPVGLLSLSFPEFARAGGQIEEPLIDSVRSALSAAIANHAPPIPEFPDTESRLRYLHDDRLKRSPSPLARAQLGAALEQRGPVGVEKV